MAEMWAKIAQQIEGGSRTDVLRALVWPNALLLIRASYCSSKGRAVFSASTTKRSFSYVYAFICRIICIFWFERLNSIPYHPSC